MTGSYLILFGRRRGDWSRRVVALAGRSGLRVVHNHFPLAVLVGGSCRHLGLGREGAVVGTLFHRHGLPRPVAALDLQDRRRIAESEGRALLDCFWGGYVAALAVEGGVSLLRDPSGALPCYHAATGDGIAFASGADLLAQCGLLSPAIDWDALARSLHAAGLPREETVLEGVSELLPGFRLRVDRGLPQAPLWSPWDHVARRDESEAGMAERVGRAVRQAVQGWAGLFGKVVLGVSGGVDSSIVAACLAGRTEAVCVTLFTEDPAGDERYYARALCRALGLALVERPYRLDDVDLGRAFAPQLPRPVGRIQAQAFDHALVEVARAAGAEAFLTGNGGDNVFGYSQSAAAIADRWLAEGPGRPLLHTLADTCRQTGCGPVEAARAALRLVRRGGGYRWRGDARLLSPEAAEPLAAMPLGHPWLAAPAGALPGKAAHVAALLRAQHTLEPGRSRFAPVVHPLLSQPVMEACLEVPSWSWRSGGIDRALARHAFAGVLPRAVLERRVKGTPDPFSSALLRARGAAIRERLLDGHMASRGLLDREAVRRALDAGSSATAEDNLRILQLVAAEAWLDHWLGRSGPA